MEVRTKEMVEITEVESSYKTFNFRDASGILVLSGSKYEFGNIDDTEALIIIGNTILKTHFDAKLKGENDMKKEICMKAIPFMSELFDQSNEYLTRLANR